MYIVDTGKVFITYLIMEVIIKKASIIFAFWALNTICNGYNPLTCLLLHVLVYDFLNYCNCINSYLICHTSNSSTNLNKGKYLNSWEASKKNAIFGEGTLSSNVVLPETVDWHIQIELF